MKILRKNSQVFHESKKIQETNLRKTPYENTYPLQYEVRVDDLSVLMKYYVISLNEFNFMDLHIGFCIFFLHRKTTRYIKDITNHVILKKNSSCFSKVLSSTCSSQKSVLDILRKTRIPVAQNMTKKNLMTDMTWQNTTFITFSKSSMVLAIKKQGIKICRDFFQNSYIY